MRRVSGMPCKAVRASILFLLAASVACLCKEVGSQSSELQGKTTLPVVARLRDLKGCSRSIVGSWKDSRYRLIIRGGGGEGAPWNGGDEGLEGKKGDVWQSGEDEWWNLPTRHALTVGNGDSGVGGGGSGGGGGGDDDDDDDIQGSRLGRSDLAKSVDEEMLLSSTKREKSAGDSWSSQCSGIMDHAQEWLNRVPGGTFGGEAGAGAGAGGERLRGGATVLDRPMSLSDLYTRCRESETAARAAKMADAARGAAMLIAREMTIATASGLAVLWERLRSETCGWGAGSRCMGAAEESLSDGDVNNGEALALQEESSAGGGGVMMPNAEVFDDEQTQVDLEGMVEAQDPVGLKSTLMTHQKMALAWMSKREEENSTASLFWERWNAVDGTVGGYINMLSGEGLPASNPPIEARGGILADDMGLGKTITIIALVLREYEVEGDETAPPPPPTTTISSGKVAAGEGDVASLMSGMHLSSDLRVQHASEPVQIGTPKKGLISLYETCMGVTLPPMEVNLRRLPGVGPTLIVAPLSVLANWQAQFLQHAKGNITITLYHGPGRAKSEGGLCGSDVVLTTYNVLAAEYSSGGIAGGGRERGKARGRGSLLHKIKWHRVVLDEAHVICNPNAKSSKAALLLRGDRRWAVSGTPIQNKLEDLYPLLSFVRVRPLEDLVTFNRLVKEPSRSKNAERREQAMSIVRQTLRVYCLRRTKTMSLRGKPIIVLPSKTEEVRSLELSRDERVMYDDMLNSGRALFRSFLRQGSVMSHYTQILERLLRLRQLCCHPALLPRNDNQGNRGDGVAEGAGLNDEEAAELAEQMESKLASGEEECSVCLDVISAPVITRCKHIFCSECMEGVVKQAGDPSDEDYRLRCPLCRAAINAHDLVTRTQTAASLQSCPRLDEGGPMDEGGDAVGGIEGGSTKLNAVLDEIGKIEGMGDGLEKAVIFSQFTSFLDIIQDALARTGRNFRRLDGSMTRENRKIAIDQFQGDPQVTILLVSIKSGGTGLNLVSANHVLITDLWWNQAVEQQAVDRVHRFGQTREVRVVRFVIRRTIEERIVELQNKKAEVIRGAIGRGEGDRSERMEETRTEDFRMLFS